MWACDVVQDRTHDGRTFRMLRVVDEFTREALAIRAERKPGSAQVLEALAELMHERGGPEHIRSDKGPEFVAQGVRDWISAVGARTAHIEPGSRGMKDQTTVRGAVAPTTGCVESFNARLRDDLLNREVFHSLREAQALIEAWRRHTNAVRPHSALRWAPPAPEVRLTKPQIWSTITSAQHAPPHCHRPRSRDGRPASQGGADVGDGILDLPAGLGPWRPGPRRLGPGPDPAGPVARRQVQIQEHRRPHRDPSTPPHASPAPFTIPKP